MVLGLGWAPDVSAKKYKWRLTQVMPEDSDGHRRATAFANEVKVKTEGRIDITIYSGGTLCDWVECHERVMRGDYEMALQPLAPTYDPRLNIGYYMPYLNTKEAKKAYKRGGWVFNMVDDLLVDQGIKGLALFPMGWAGMTTRKVPDGWREMKPNKMKISNEAFSAIQTGVADGEMGGPPYQGYQFRDIQGVWIQYNDYLEPWWFFMNLKLFNKLDKKDQKILLDAAEKQVKGRWDYFLEEDEQYRQKLRDFGLQVLMPTDKELKAFAKAIREDVWPKMEPLMGKALVDRARKEVGMPVK
jgi:TRAP-type C4-dicarboxylate transport system substrate-binding protein